MKLHRFAIFSSALMLACACVEEPEVIVNPQPQTGSEVQFGLSLGDGVDTRTVYGQETATGFPIYWVDGDLVHIASPHCINAPESIIYEVSCSTATQNFADALTKTTDIGLQWGEGYETTDADGNKVTGLHDFYSIYPSAGTTLTASKDGNVTADLTVASTQYASTSTVNGIIYAQPGDMGNVMMYAHTQGAKSGEVVDLRYKPFSTVLEFTIKIPSESAANQTDSIIVQGLSLTAPSGTDIAGDFTFNFPSSSADEPSIEVKEASGSNSITVHFLEDNEYTTLLTKDDPDKMTLKAKMCIMPISGVTTMDGWAIKVITSAGDFTKTISGTGETTKLAPGKVHKITLPYLKYGSDEWNYTLDKWITFLPDYKNIYLTEISLPGAWYAGSKTSDGYQATETISDFWGKGVRAFAVECRTSSEYKVVYQTDKLHLDVYGWEPTRICVSGQGRNPSIGAGYTANTYLSTVIANIAGSINPEEFGVLVLSYADGGSGGHRTVDHNFFVNGIANEITQSGATNIFAGTELDENTTVEDVLGQLIIKINIDDRESVAAYTDNDETRMSISAYNGSMSSLFSYNPIFSQLPANTSAPHYSKITWETWADANKTFATRNNNDFLWCFSSANRTASASGSDIPTYIDRQTALKTMMDHSKEIYAASSHNIWFYFNCGGTQTTSSTDETTSATDFAKEMNPWLLETIKSKTDPSPLGIVMFNQCTGDNGTYKGADIIKEIIEMNSKFYLKHFGDETTTQTAELQSVSPNYSAAVVDTGADAISWE